MRRVPGLARILAFVLVAPALAGCESLGGLWGPKDDPVLDEPADRIYNEGLYLLNIKKDTKGAAKPFARSDLERPVTREFCPDCGTHLVTRPQRPVVVVKVGTLDDPKQFGAPQMAIFTVDKQPFHQIPDGLPAFERMPQR